MRAAPTSATKTWLTEARARDTVLTELFDVGWPHTPHRVLRNSTYVRWEAAAAHPRASVRAKVRRSPTPGACTFSRVPEPLMLRGLDPAVIERVVASARKRSFSRGDIVFHQGDPGASIRSSSKGTSRCA